MDLDPGKWTFGGLTRGVAGGFDDAGLEILSSTTEDLAGAFGARNVPTALRAIEILGINQWVKSGVPELSEIQIQMLLQALYQEPDNVELYPGLVCEDTKKPEVPGSGLCAGLTVAEAILSDAVALVRGDRYYTIDSSPANLTSWGYNEIAPDPNVRFGTTIYKLLQRAYPGWYRSNSVYALFPLTVPSENRVILAAKGMEADYGFDWSRFIPQPTPILTKSGDGLSTFDCEVTKSRGEWNREVEDSSFMVFAYSDDHCLGFRLLLASQDQFKPVFELGIAFP
jgi:hypothetical protein